MPKPIGMRASFALLLGLAACTPDRPAPRPEDSARAAFGDSAAALVIGTDLYELRAQLYEKIPNPNRDDESPLADRAIPHPTQPGPHTMNGTLYAELRVLRALFGDSLPVRVDTTRDHVFVGQPPVLIISHRHRDTVYVPVKLFARQYGAYTDISCTFANCAFIWPRSVIEHMRSLGAVGGAGMVEGHAEGIVKDIDVTRLPTG